jgi:hypothetical protein
MIIPLCMVSVLMWHSMMDSGFVVGGALLGVDHLKSQQNQKFTNHSHSYSSWWFFGLDRGMTPRSDPEASPSGPGRYGDSTTAATTPPGCLRPCPRCHVERRSRPGPARRCRRERNRRQGQVAGAYQNTIMSDNFDNREPAFLCWERCCVVEPWQVAGTPEGS